MGPSQKTESLCLFTLTIYWMVFTRISCKFIEGIAEIVLKSFATIWFLAIWYSSTPFPYPDFAFSIRIRVYYFFNLRSWYHHDCRKKDKTEITLEMVQRKLESIGIIINIERLMKQKWPNGHVISAGNWFRNIL